MSFVLPFALGVRLFTGHTASLAESVYGLCVVAHLLDLSALLQPITVRLFGPLVHSLGMPGLIDF